MKSFAALILWSTAIAASAQGMPPGGPPHPHRVPSPEALATIPNLTAAQQVEVHKILLDSRDAHEAVATKARAERDALMKKTRAEHERIEEQSAERLRKLLGDDGFRQFAEWQLAHRPGRGRGFGRGGPGGHGPHRGPHPPGPDRTETMPDDAPAAPGD